MSRRIVRLSLDHLPLLAEVAPSCAGCLFWELDPVRRGRVGERPEVRDDEKRAWLARVLGEWGTCGQLLVVDGEPAGFALYAPAAYVPGAAAFATAPVSPDAVLLTTLRVAPGHEGRGLGKLLVQAVARDLVERGDVAALEAFGAPGTGGCTVPVAMLHAVGFRTHRAHPVAPRLRMDLRATLTWRSEVERAASRLLGAVRPTPAPAPGEGRTRRACRPAAARAARPAIRSAVRR